MMPVTAPPSPPWLIVDPLVLQENVTLLQMIDKEPVKPMENDLAFFKKSTPNSRFRAFTIERERNLADSLAFLAATTDDPTKIIAVSIEDHVGRYGFTIRLAANSGELEDVVSGFRKIADVLKLLASNNKLDNAAELLLLEIVALDCRRILTRLRSQHVKTLKGSRNHKDRPYLISRLARAFSLVPHNNLTQKQKITLQDVQSKLKRMQKSFSKLEGVQFEESGGEVLDLLKVLISIVSCLPSRADLWALLRRVENSGEFNHQSLSGLLIDTEKIRKYGATAKFLTDAASGQPLFSQIDVEAVETLVPVPISISPTIALSKTLERLHQSRRITKQHLRAFTPQILLYQNLYSKQMATSTPRVHAEIQLIFFYEAHPDITPPRVISSSKDACFLCNLFIQKHGKYFTSATHGVVYERWALPETSQMPLPLAAVSPMGAVVSNFNRAVEESISRAVRQPRKTLKHPLESACRLPIWTSSAASIARTSAQHLDTSRMASPRLTNVTSKETVAALASLPPEISDSSNPVSLTHAIPLPNSIEIIQPVEISGEGPDGHTRLDSLNPTVSPAVPPPPVSNHQSETTQSNQISSGGHGGHEKSSKLATSPIDIVRTLSPVKLDRGQISHHQISPSNPTFLLNTPRIHLEFSWHVVSASASAGSDPARTRTQEPDELSSAFDITAHYLRDFQDFKEGSKLIDVDELRANEDLGVLLRAETWGPMVGEWLYLRRKGDTVAFKYSFADPGLRASARSCAA